MMVMVRPWPWLFLSLVALASFAATRPIVVVTIAPNALTHRSAERTSSSVDRRQAFNIHANPSGAWNSTLTARYQGLERASLGRDFAVSYTMSQSRPNASNPNLVDRSHLRAYCTTVAPRHLNNWTGPHIDNYYPATGTGYVPLNDQGAADFWSAYVANCLYPTNQSVRYLEVANECDVHLAEVNRTWKQLIALHQAIADRIHHDYPPTPTASFLVGGPTLAFPEFQLKNFRVWNETTVPFLQLAPSIDYLTYHVYSTQRSQDPSDTVPRAGSNVLALVDLMAASSLHYQQRLLPQVISEYGLSFEPDAVFYSSASQWNVLREINNKLLRWLQQPALVQKAVPFILDGATWYRPPNASYSYPYALWRNVSGTYQDTYLALFYPLWRDFEGAWLTATSSSASLPVVAATNASHLFVALHNDLAINTPVQLQFPQLNLSHGEARCLQWSAPEQAPILVATSVSSSPIDGTASLNLTPNATCIISWLRQSELHRTVTEYTMYDSAHIVTPVAANATAQAQLSLPAPRPLDATFVAGPLPLPLHLLGSGVTLLNVTVQFRCDGYLAVLGGRAPRPLSAGMFALSRRAVRHAKTQASDPNDIQLSHVRNVGIVAHIDAGKTTTTERMLCLAGVTRVIGTVDDGNTQMDYLKDERERGITIVSAATTFHWGSTQFNLIDTPGHVDFTLEVERALRVLDGAVLVLDGVAGVEAQTIKVMSQADRYNVPVIAFVNKLDRLGADFSMTVDSVRNKLKRNPLVLQVPVTSPEGGLEVVVDLVHAREYRWNNGAMTVEALGPAQQSIFSEGRAALVDALTLVDEELAEELLEVDDLDTDAIGPEQLTAALRRVTLAREGLPILCGAARREKGVEPLLDAMADYLPSPLDRPPVELLLENEVMTLPAEDQQPLSALAFKVVQDPHRGPIVFARIYSGVLHSRAVLVNSTRQVKERATRVMRIHADSKPKKLLTARLHGINIPEPVFSCVVEPETVSAQASLDAALAAMIREDPSLRVHVDEETGQTVLSGMGELHLEIVRSRLLEEYKVVVEAGKLRVAYRERVGAPMTVTRELTRNIQGVDMSATATVTVEPTPDTTHPDPVLAPGVRARIVEAFGEQEAVTLETLVSAARAAMSRGAFMGYPMRNSRLIVKDLDFAIGVPASLLANALVNAARQALREGGCELLQPIMALRVEVPDEMVGNVLNDLSSNRMAAVGDLSSLGDMRIVEAEVPISTMIGYAAALRSVTHGRGSFHMHFQDYAPVPQAQALAIKQGL
ncbi:uncharacterized protein MONBRDRAFT_32987 [Monosiga brevicollis MX1]|uniref:Tr-type G domain-containing protein n=1 Tax=Monosiga brevicollis TaxID=81824 RepID=A9V2W3_MONBE|nr:uncharacterized protein MONBRDRAFT_32987 [Monosiga brevicollis MX1]EDQ88083.1 predicted protein [Monosiga brevicollis MX1]|eukprot:XP_001747159.1 hypothetical protein [Monosiga brevicollis MX1]